MNDDGEKIKISWDDIESVPEQSSQSQIQQTSGTESWGQVNPTQPGSSMPPSSSGSVFYKSWFYLGAAGLVAGIVAWGAQEIFNQDSEPLFDYHGMSLDEIRMSLDEIMAKMRVQMGIWFAVIGAILAIGFGVIEGLVSRSSVQALRGAGFGFLAGILGGFIAGYFAQWLYASIDSQFLSRSLGWGLAGGIVGVSFGLAQLSPKKAMLGIAGGFVGGFIGGMLFDPIAEETQNAALSRFVGIVSIGLFSGILISLAEQIAKSAWVKIEAGRLIGKQFIIYKNPTRIGALPENEIYLFKDTAISPQHALIEQRAGGRFLKNVGAPNATRINGQIVNDQKLRNGDAIQIGESVLRYGER